MIVCSTKSKVFLNWILFDDQFKMVGSGSGVQQVGANNTFTVMAQSGIAAAKNGFLYVYVSNETPNINVYFDNLQVTSYSGPLLQEQSYYPFGLQMAGISDKAMNRLDSKNKFNGGVELEEDYGVNLYSTFYRQYDPQIGRFGGVDVLSEKSVGMSVYQFGGNNPVSFNDPIGALHVNAFGQFLNTPEQMMGNFSTEVDSWEGGGGGDGGGGGGGGSVLDPSRFIRNLQNLISQGNEIDIAGFSTTDKGNLYGVITYNPQGDGMDAKVMGVLLDNSGSMSNYESNGWENTQTILEASGFVWDATREGMIGAQKLGNLASGTSYVIQDIGKLGIQVGRYKMTLGMGGKALGFIGVAIPLIDMATNKNADYWSDGTDAVMGAVAFIPGVGWIISGAYFIANTAVENATGEGIGDHIGDYAKSLDMTSQMNSTNMESEFGPDNSGDN